MEYLTGLLENTTFPATSAMILGLMTAISPCPLATNITAVGYISRDLSDRHKVFINGLVYTLGRAISYTLLAALIYFGADQFRISGIFQQYGERILGPLLIVVGVLMLGIIKIKLPGLNFLGERVEKRGIHKSLDILILGIVYALAFCPYSGVLYFGMLMPMTIADASGLFLPVIFAVATGVPVIIFSWLLAYTVSGVSAMYGKIRAFEYWFRRVIAVVFIGVGIYYIIVVWL
jgi:threonine/homoserine/homoserine lactone efflux protein